MKGKLLTRMASVVLAALLCGGSCPLYQAAEPTLQEKTVTVTVCGVSAAIQTQAATVEQLLLELELPPTGGYRASHLLSDPTEPGMQLQLDLYESRMEVTHRLTPSPILLCRDPSLPLGEQAVLLPGTPGLTEQVAILFTVNGAPVAKDVVSVVCKRAATPRVVALGTGEGIRPSRSYPLVGNGFLLQADGTVTFLSPVG